MKNETALRKVLLDHLEGALVIAEELNDSKVRSVIEVALDEARALDIERLRGGHR